MSAVVAIVGRPNVGKSTIFNRLLGVRKAIVHDESGVTRDRHYGDSFWNGKDFTVIDTGGYLPDVGDVIVTGIREQVELAMREADVILHVVDAAAGISDLDKIVAQVLHQQKKPVLIVANKADNEEIGWNASEFYELGYDDIFTISALNGTGTGDLLDRTVALLPDEPDQSPYEGIPRLAIIGRPNVGKSSLVNALLDDNRSIVTDIAGTTRDSINSLFHYQDKEYILVDTAGLRKKAKVKENIEFYSTIRTDRSIRECDVAVLLLDATLGLEAQDIRVLREAERYNKGIVIAINKWDLVEKETNTFRDFQNEMFERIKTMDYVPVITLSATTKQRIFKLIDIADEVIEERKKKITTSKLNDFVQKITRSRPLPMARGKQLKINYATQVKAAPPVFLFFMNSPTELPANYRRYIENQLRETFGFKGVPITMAFKDKNKDEILR